MQAALGRERLSLGAYIVNPGYLQFFGIVAVVQPLDNVLAVIVPHSAESDDCDFHVSYSFFAVIFVVIRAILVFLCPTY